MVTFQSRYKKLNPRQREAVDTTDGPLVVIAGPGTGKTELLSMRAANILRTTDTLPESILCLTFTDSGANAMRERLSDTIGPDAYKIAIHTFHSFGTEVINHNNQYFYHGAHYKPADELSCYELLTGIFDELDYSNPLAGKNNGEYTHLSDAVRVMSELKRSGLTSDELLKIVSSNEEVLDSVEKELSIIFANKPNIAMLTVLVSLAERVAAIKLPNLPAAITPLANVLALSMAHAFDDAIALNKTTPITAWRNEWLEKDINGVYVFKSRKRHAKLRAISHIYFAYLSRMEQAGLYDYDDMILNVVHGMETQPDLKYNLQEKYQYIMVDEFQDTNLAQLRILFNLADNKVNEGRPNIMVVGDDDQAIYSFQGADINNIHRFREEYSELTFITLKDNYRSTQPIISHASEVITQGEDRLESTITELDKTLTTHLDIAETNVNIYELPSPNEEREWIIEDIKQKVSHGTAPETIAVFARRHSDLIDLVPYFHHHGITVNYERRDNVLDIPVIVTLEKLSRALVSIFERRHDITDSLMPELLTHPAFGITPESIWRLSLHSYRNHTTWLESMAATPEFMQLYEWLIALAQRVTHDPLEVFIDTLIGIPNDTNSEQPTTFTSPLYDYYFGEEILKQQPDDYLAMLNALRTIRTKLREYHQDEQPQITSFIEFIRMHRQIGTTITSIRSRSERLAGAINLMTAHKSKGLEFDNVYIMGSIDSAWGERVRSRSRLISYPENLPLAPAGNTYNERLRLFYVAMTRAKHNLTISYSSNSSNGKTSLIASFLVGTSIAVQNVAPTATPEHLIEQSLLDWHSVLYKNPTKSMRELLAPQLEQYKLSSTHLNNFIDITRGGPAKFLLNNLLRFPQAKSATASYGTAIHAALQKAHNHLVATNERRPVEDVLGDFTTELKAQHLGPEDYALYSKKGAESLTKFLGEKYSTFSQSQKTELNFAGQGAVQGEARLTGSIDLVDIKNKQITVVDYKTGKPSRKWKGLQDNEKIKLHKYKQQLMFYQLLIGSSRDYSRYNFAGGMLQFVEPDTTGKIHSLEAEYSNDELEEFKKLVAAIWQCIINLDFPDINEFEPNYKGVLKFEQYLIDKHVKKS